MLELREISKSFGGHRVTNEISLSFPHGSLSAIIGPNGAGKTTLFNLVSGAIKPETGAVYLAQERISGLPQHQVVKRGLVRAFQVASLFSSMTAFEALAAASDHSSLGLQGLTRRFPTAAGTREAQRLVELLELGPVAHRLVSEISHGDQKMLDVGLALARGPTVLLLDEPTAGMGPDERWKMMETVQRLWALGSLTVIFIEHDMDIVFSVAQDVIVLSQGSLLLRGSPDVVRYDPRVIEAYLGSYANKKEPSDGAHPQSS